MKKFFYFTILMAALGFEVFSQQKVLTKSPAPEVQPVRAYLNHAVFQAPAKGTYLETYLTVIGNSVAFKKVKNKFQGTVKMEINFSQNGAVVLANAYNLHSPEILDTSKKPDFIDMQRYWLKPGQYEMQVKISDNNVALSNAQPHTQTITVTEAAKDSIAFSDIELLESYAKAETPGPNTKGGYDIIPYSRRYYPETITKLAFYVEAYNSLTKLGFDSRFVLVYYVEGTESKEKVTGYHAFSKQKSNAVTPLLSQFDVTELPTGEYNLVIEMRDNANGLLAEKKLPFTRVANTVKIKIADIQTIDTAGTFIRKVNNLDTLKDYIACLWPISSTTERDWQYNQIRNADAKLMQQYMYAFWVNRDLEKPEKAWLTYRAEAVKIKKKYACGKIPGYLTDRGRVYLQYFLLSGPPSSEQQVPYEPESYPYEVWQYYRIKDPVTGNFQSNKKFIFYNRELDGNCYQLLHSDARGEKREDRWQIVLKQRTNQIMNLDETTPVNKNYGSQAEDLFQNPR